MERTPNISVTASMKIARQTEQDLGAQAVCGTSQVNFVCISIMNHEF
jgi:hypothetical protein